VTASEIKVFESSDRLMLASARSAKPPNATEYRGRRLQRPAVQSVEQG
jgi:hypothetical protein